MQISELQYGQVNNVLTSFNTSSLNLRFLEHFKLEKLNVSSSNSTINKALYVKHNDRYVIVNIEWGKYIMKQASEDFTLTIKYNNRTIDALTVRVRIHFKKINASIKVSISHTEVMWTRDMYVSLIVEPNHSQSDLWKYISNNKIVKISKASKFKPIDNNYAIQFNVLRRKEIVLKYNHSLPIEPLSMNMDEKIVAEIDAEVFSFNIRLVPNDKPNYRIDLLRIKPCYTIGSNDLDIWKVQISNENPYAVLSINTIVTKSDKLQIKSLSELEWIISIKSVEVFKRLPSSDIFAEVEVQVACLSSKNIGLILSNSPKDDIHYLYIKAESCLQLFVLGDRKIPLVIYRDSVLQKILVSLKNMHSKIIVKNIRISSTDSNIRINGNKNLAIRELKPSNSVPISLNLSSSCKAGTYYAPLKFECDYAKEYSYELPYVVREKRPCSLEVRALPCTFVETYAGENYTNHKVCDVEITAIANNEFGPEGSYPIQVKNIKVSSPFYISTNENTIEPGMSIICGLILNGYIDNADNKNDFNKLVDFKYEHE